MKAICALSSESTIARSAIFDISMRLSSGKCFPLIQARIFDRRNFKASEGYPERCPDFRNDSHTSSSSDLICAKSERCLNGTCPASIGTSLAIWLSLSAPRAVAAATCFRRGSSSRTTGGDFTSLSYSSAVSNSIFPVLKSMCLDIFVLAIMYLTISGGTISRVSIGPIVLPLELDMGPMPLICIHS